MMGVHARRESRHTARTLIILMAAVAVAIGLIVLALSRAGGREMSIRQLPCYASQTPVPFGDRVLCYEGGMLTCVDTSGNVSWRFPLGDGASIDAGDGVIVAWSGTQVYIIGQDGIATYNESMDGIVQFARAGSQYIAFLVGENTNSTLVVKNRQGVTVSTESNDFKSLIVLDVGFFENRDQYMWTLSLDAYGVVADTILNVYNVGNSLVADVSLGDSLTYAVAFGGTRLYTIGTEQVRVFDFRGTETESAAVLSYGWQLIARDASGPDTPSLLFAPTSQAGATASLLDLRLVKGTSDQRITLPDACSGALTHRGGVYAFSGDTLYYTWDGGATFHEAALSVNARVVTIIGMTRNGAAIIGCDDDSVYAVTLPTR